MIMKNVLASEKYTCCGCTACEQACPVNAIKMLADNEGFSYPHMDQNKCIHCNRCIAVCPFKNIVKEAEVQGYKRRIVAAKNLDDSVKMKSSSGGVFSLLIASVLQDNVTAYGAAFNEVFEVVHEPADTVEKSGKFRGAKYVQSKLNDTFQDIGRKLKSHEGVFFSGTPCQVAGLKNYLRLSHIDDINLITVDIVCHGVPSPLIWKEYLNSVTNGVKPAYVSFRDKQNGWHHSELVIRGKNINISQDHGKNPYSLLYFNHYSMRPSCSQCPFSNMNRIGDITIGDFWGIEKIHPEIDDDKGVSLVIINSEKGAELFGKILDYLYVIDSNEVECLQPNLTKPSSLPANREDFWNDFRLKGIDHAIKMFTYYGDNIPAIRIERRLLSVKNKLKRVGIKK